MGLEHRTLTDTQRYVATVGPLVENAQVQEAITAAVVQAVKKQVDVESLVDQALGQVVPDRPKLQELSGSIAAGVYSLVERVVTEVVSSQQFADLWVTINIRAQQALVRILEGENTGAVRLEGDNVVLDLSEVITAVQQRLVDAGLTFVQNLPIPQVDKQIVLLNAPELRKAQTVYAFASPISTWALPVVGCSTCCPCCSRCVARG